MVVEAYHRREGTSFIGAQATADHPHVFSGYGRYSEDKFCPYCSTLVQIRSGPRRELKSKPTVAYQGLEVRFGEPLSILIVGENSVADILPLALSQGRVPAFPV